MKFLEFLAGGFIAAFGISQPSQKDKHRVSILLGGLVLTIFLIVVGLCVFFVWRIHSPG